MKRKERMTKAEEIKIYIQGTTVRKNERKEST
jgi:hypothetical protein